MATNTPPGVSQRAPGGLQSSILFEPLVDTAAKELGVDQVAIRKINAPVNGSQFGLNPPAQANRPRGKITSSYVKEALDRGAELFNWEERKKRSGQRRGTKVTGVGVSTSTFTAGSIGVDGLLDDSSPTARCTSIRASAISAPSRWPTPRVSCAEVLDFPWENVVVVWGNTGNHVAWSSIQAGSQTTHAHTRANFAAGSDAKRKLQELAALELGGNADAYRVGGAGVAGPGGRLTWAQAAERAIKRGGKFDGHELPGDINAMTKTSGAALAGLGLMGVARDNYPRDGSTYSFVAGFAEVEVDVETGVYTIVDYFAVADVGTVLHPRSLGGQILGGAIQGMSHTRSQKLVYDTHYGVAIGKRMYHNKPPTMLDIPINARWEAVNIPDPGNPVVGAKGVGEPAVGEWRCLRAVRAGRCGRLRHHPPHAGAAGAGDGSGNQGPAVPRRTANGVHLGKEHTMPVIRDVMPAFELFQPTSIADTVGLLDSPRQRVADGWRARQLRLVEGSDQAARSGHRSRHRRRAARHQGSSTAASRSPRIPA